MPQIIERKRQDGSIAYVAQINIRRNGKWAHSESHGHTANPEPLTSILQLQHGSKSG